MLILQFTGLSGAGKTTLATAVKDKLLASGITIAVIDGDVYRKTHCSDLGYSKADRIENIRRLGVIASAMSEEVVIIAAINPYQEGRQELRNKYGAPLIYLNCDLNTLVKRDTKGLYHRALMPQNNPQKINNLTGVNDPFDVPKNADLILDTASLTEAECVELLCAFIYEKTTEARAQVRAIG